MGSTLRFMPELAEVEYYRHRWDAGLGQTVQSVALHGQLRVFRGTDIEELQRTLRASVFSESSSHGKWMMFRFARQRRFAWIGIHLGMTGELHCEAANFSPGTHDHFVLQQRERALVFTDPRQFGRVKFHAGSTEPEWWAELPPEILSKKFTVQWVEEFLLRRGRAPLKAVLLMQQAFPGIGNWMADEVLWRARLHPALKAGRAALHALRLWKELRWVTAKSLRIVGKDFSSPPASWLFPHRWQPGGRCPRDGTLLRRATIGRRTTAWCPRCQFRGAERVPAAKRKAGTPGREAKE